MRSKLVSLCVVLVISAGQLTLADVPVWQQAARELDETKPKAGDYAPAFSLRAYNEDVALRLVKSPLIGLSFFVGLRPEFPRKAVLLGFFAVWNEKSRQDLAVFQKLYKKFKDSGVVALMISLDNKDIHSVYEAIERERVTFPVLRDRFGVVARRYGVAGLPTVLVIDKDGKIVVVEQGYREDSEAYLERELRSLLSIE